MKDIDGPGAYIMGRSIGKILKGNQVCNECYEGTVLWEHREGTLTQASWCQGK